MSEANTKTVLFVDDELPLLQLIGEIMRQRSGGAWEIELAESGAKALTILKQRRIDLLVVDARMPVMNGQQLVRLTRPSFPHVPIVLLTGYSGDLDHEAFAREGVDVVLDKPQTPEGYETLFQTLAQLMQIERRQGFRGLIERIELQDVIQLECLRRNSAVLDIFTNAEAGEVFIRQGHIIHAATGNLTGEAALNRLLSLKGGEFRLKPFREPDVATIARNWEVLLMDAAKARDEISEAGNTAPPEQPEAQTTFPEIVLTPEELQGAPCVREFVAVTADADALVNRGASRERIAQLGRLAASLELFPSTPLGRLTLFEGTTAHSHVAAHVAAEALLVAVSERQLAP